MWGDYGLQARGVKGLEFDNVVVDYSKELYSDDAAREKRVRYVQFTRARKKLLIRYEDDAAETVEGVPTPTISSECGERAIVCLAVMMRRPYGARIQERGGHYAVTAPFCLVHECRRRIKSAGICPAR